MNRAYVLCMYIIFTGFLCSAGCSADSNETIPVPSNRPGYLISKGFAYYTPADSLTIHKAAISDVIQTSSSFSHIVALKSDGTVWAWGDNEYGQLGDDTQEDCYYPVQVKGLNDVVSVAAFGLVSYAVKRDGTLWYWGTPEYTIACGNIYKIVFCPEPVQMKSVSNVKKLYFSSSEIRPYGSSGSYFALRNDGTVYAWGYNSLGQEHVPESIDPETGEIIPDYWYDIGYGRLGVGDGPYVSIPQIIPGLTNVKDISSSSLSTYFLKKDGSVYALGNSVVKLPDGTAGHSTVPVRFEGLKDIISIEAGSYLKSAIDSKGRLWEWGGHFVCLTPYLIPFASDIVSATSADVSPGSGGYYFWGPYGEPVYICRDGNVRYCEYDSELDTYVFRKIPGFENIRSMEAYTAICNDSTVLTFGIIFNSMYGTGPVQGRTEEFGIPKVTVVQQGGGYDAAVDVNGFLWTWGYNTYGQFGNGTTDDSEIPIKNPFINDVVSIALANNTTLVLKKDGSVWSCGDNYCGILGRDPLDPTLFGKVDNLEHIVKVSAGNSFAMALDEDGILWGWGGNYCKQLAMEEEEIHSPLPIPGIPRIKDMDCGYYHSIALGEDGVVWTWGENHYGELGQGFYSRDSRLPGKVHGLKNVIKVEAGNNYSAVLTSKGTVWVWGTNYKSLLGLNTYDMTGSCFPIKNQHLRNIQNISAGDSFLLTQDTDGIVYGWGDNFHGQIESDYTHVIEIPQVIYEGAGARNIFAGDTRSFFIK